MDRQASSQGLVAELFVRWWPVAKLVVLGAATLIAGLAFLWAWQSGDGKLDPLPGATLYLFLGVFGLNFLVHLRALFALIYGYIWHLFTARRIWGFVGPVWMSRLPVPVLCTLGLIKFTLVSAVGLLVSIAIAAWLSTLLWATDTAAVIAFRACLYVTVWAAFAMVLLQIPVAVTAIRVRR